MQPMPTPGGRRLRALRESRDQTQLDVELNASLGMGYLQRLERGRVRQPERDTVERILSALEARYTERREILELFGYIVDAPIPDEAEIDWAIRVCEDDIQQANFPIYLLDCCNRLIYWNHFVSRLYNGVPSTRIAGNYISMLKLIFDPAYQAIERIHNKETFFPAQIRALRYEQQKFRDEAWYRQLIDEMLTFESFRIHWEQEQQKPIYIPARPLVPLQFMLDDTLLSFRLIAEPFVQDQRFRVIYYLPDNPATAQQCMVWSIS